MGGGFSADFDVWLLKGRHGQLGRQNNARMLILGTKRWVRCEAGSMTGLPKVNA
jgi:hypothetical protein